MDRGMRVIDREVADAPSPSASNSDRPFLPEVVDWTSRNRTRVLNILLVAAILVTVARLMGPFEVGKDQALQLEAAGRLVDGLGLTSTYFTTQHPSDISVAPEPVYLTWWPPALSLLVAGFLKLGISLVVSLKVIYGVTTLIGWVGWAIIASHLLSGPIRLGRRSYPLQYVIAALLPVFTTPVWHGTDIFLWAGTPLIVLWLFRSQDSGAFSLYIVLAGLTFGYLYSIRYASAFLGLVALFVLAQSNSLNVKAVVKKFGVFLITSLLIIVPTLIYIKLFSHHDSVLPEYFDTTYKASSTRLIWGLLEGSFITSIPLFGSNLVYLVAMRLRPPIPSIIGVFCFIAVFAVPFIVFMRSSLSRREYRNDLALSLSLLPVALIIFLVASSLMTAQPLLGIERYYNPVILCCPLIFYWLAGFKSLNRALRYASIAVVLVFAVKLFLYFPYTGLKSPARIVHCILSFTPSKSEGQSSTSHPISYPSNQIYSLKENSRNKLKELAHQYPDAVFFLANQAYFIYETDSLLPEGLNRGVVFRRLPRKYFWESAFTSKQIKVFWVIEPGNQLDYVPESDKKIVYNDPLEKTRIFESDFPAGYKFFNEADSQPPQPR